jgi:uncharacterized protein YegL
MSIVRSLVLGSCLGVLSSSAAGCAGEDPGTQGSFPLGGFDGGNQTGVGPVVVAPGSGADAGPGTGTGTGIPGSLCETRTIDAYGAAPDMLIVLDRSSSMSLFGRWDPSKTAVKTIASDFGGLISFGLSTFPGEREACAAGPLEVPLKINNAQAIGSRVDQLRTNGFTPTGPALMAALNVLGDRSPSLDEQKKPAFVLLVTDGEPTCQGIPLIPDELQQQNARAAVMALKAKNIPTYVIGYQIDPAFQGLMNELASLGGTGTFRPAESADQIVTTFREITKDVVKCSFDLAEAPVDPRFVRVQIDKQTVPLNNADGWVITGKTVTLQGGSCAKLKDGKGHLLNAQVECKEVEIL